MLYHSASPSSSPNCPATSDTEAVADEHSVRAACAGRPFPPPENRPGRHPSRLCSVGKTTNKSQKCILQILQPPLPPRRRFPLSIYAESCPHRIHRSPELALRQLPIPDPLAPRPNRNPSPIALTLLLLLLYSLKFCCSWATIQERGGWGGN